MQDEHFYDLMVGYFSDNLSAEEVAELVLWRDSNEANSRLFRQLHTIWMSIPNMEQLAKYDKVLAYKKFMECVHAHQRQRRHRRVMYMMCYAAILLVTVGVFSYLFYIKGQDMVESRFADISVEAPLGSTTRMTLPDGTQVWLNAGSRITYSQGFGVRERNVKLVGEGYFEVAHNEKLPFHVNSSALKLRVLGTKFDFRDYPDDPNAMVTLVEGRVALGSHADSANREYQLQPNECAVFEKGSKNMTIQSSVAQASRQWTQGVLMFHDTTLREIALTLSRSYHQRIVIADRQLATLNFYATFNRDEQTLTQILDALSATGRIRYKLQGKTYIIY